MANRRFIDFPIASTVGDSDIILIWQSGANKQTTKATFLSGLPENLDELNDVAISGLTNGQILRYDSVTGKWENTDQGNLDLNDLNDVSIVSPSNGQVLVYNSSTSKWENSSGGYVPYVGAVTTVDLGAQGLRAGYVRFDTSVVTVPDEQGLMYWDDSRSTAALIMNGTLQHIGQDVFFYVKNSSGSSIPKGTAVRFAGTNGASGHILIEPFLANGTYPSSYFMGVTSETIANGAFGQVMHFGELTGINTSGFTAGALLYASTTVAGGFQTTAPVAPNNIVLIAAAINSTNNGAIIVRPQIGSNINNDEGVKITSPTTGDLLQLQAGGLWENKTLAQVIGSAYVPSTRTLTINGTTQDLSANRTFNVGTVTSVGLSSATSGVTIGSTPVTSSGTITLAIATASGSQNGLLSSTDWTTFNSKQNALTNPVTGTGTTNYLPKFTGSTTIGNSNLINDASGNLGLGITPTNVSNYIRLQISGTTGGIFDLLSGNTRHFTIYNDSSSSVIGTVTNTPLIFQTNDGTKMTLAANGNLLVGTTTDNGARLQVSGRGTFTAPFGQNALVVNGVNSIFAQNIIAGTGTSTSFGLTISAGTNSSDIAFQIYNSAENAVRLFVRGDGNVGIGTASPSYRLVVNSATDGISAGISGSTFGIRFDNGGTFSSGMSTIHGVDSTLVGSYQPIMLNGLDVRFGTSANERMRITSGGNVLIGTTTEAAGVRLRVEGGVIRSLSTYDNTVATAANLVVSAGGTFERSTSSLKYKKEVRNYDKGLEVLKNMRPVYYKGKSQSDGNKQFAGLIAEEIHELGLNEFVQYANDGTPDALAYTHMVAILINSIKELKQEIDTLKN